MTSHLVGIQQLRFWAAFIVLVHHALETISVRDGITLSPEWVLLGASGVDIFFVISGFVIWRASRGFSTEIGAPTFLLRRALRIYPLYWICLLVLIALWSTGLAYRNREISAATLTNSLLLLPPAPAELILPVAWTLVYEVYFYLLASAVLLLPWMHLRPAMLCLLMLVLPVGLAQLGATHLSARYGDPIVLEFLFGCLLASQARRLEAMNLRVCLLLLGASGLVFSSYCFYSGATAGLSANLHWWAWGVPALLVVASALMHPLRKSSWLGVWVARLGGASYAIYLTHSFVLISLARLLKEGWFPAPWSLALACMLSVLLAVLLGWLVHRWVEVPLAGQLTRLLAGRPVPHRAADPVQVH